MKIYQEEHARGVRPWPCPLVEIQPENAEALELFWIATNEETRGYAGLFSEALLASFTADERVRVLRRALRALGDDRIIEARQKLHDEAIEKMRAQRRK